MLATVCSRPAAGRAVVDCGAKGIDLVGGAPDVRGVDGAFRLGGDEHGIIDLAGARDGAGADAAGGDGAAVGDVLELLPQHCDPTVNLHDFFVCHRGGVVEEVLPITGRGPGL